MTGREIKRQVRAPNGRPEVTAEARFWAKVEKTAYKARKDAHRG